MFFKNIYYIAAIKNVYGILANFRLIVNVDFLHSIETLDRLETQENSGRYPIDL